MGPANGNPMHAQCMHNVHCTYKVYIVYYAYYRSLSYSLTHTIHWIVFRHRTVYSLQCTAAEQPWLLQLEVYQLL